VDWKNLLSNERLGHPVIPYPNNRWEFQRDFSRITFSSAFRRLQDKTQVFPLAENDHTRTRLTHSMEVSCIGRALGTIVGKKLIENKGLDKDRYAPSDFGEIVAAACLAHDIGNPPFGHSGEKAIQQWFRFSQVGKKVIEKIPKKKRNDFLNFEGNAQGFRTLTRLQFPSRSGGLQLTYATLGAYTKYPTTSENSNNKKIYKGKSNSKHGFYFADKEIFEQVAEKLDLAERVPGLWLRHPLAFLVEAADDITYRIIDLEDGFLLDKIGFEETEELLRPISNYFFEETEYNNLESPCIGSKDSLQQKIEYLGRKALNQLVISLGDCFISHEKQIIDGTFDDELINHIEFKENLEKIFIKSQETTYKCREVLDIEVPGFRVISGLLESFVPAVIDVEQGSTNQPQNKKIKEYMEKILGISTPGNQFIDNCDSAEEGEATYDKLLAIIDFICASRELC